jgi:hypothetical protein
VFFPELFPFAAFVLLATPVALIFRAWFVHRSTVVKERARTERMRQALRSTAPTERAAILRALRELEAEPQSRTDDEP